MKLSEQVLRVICFERISEKELAVMLSEACITRLRGFNLRYFRWLFKVEGDELVSMQQVQVRETGSGDSRQMEDHDACEGRGCKACGWVGQVGRWVTDKELPTYAPIHLNCWGIRRRTRQQNLGD